jgi:response regulator RpfG family c-di-GMP phosphodiesterase
VLFGDEDIDRAMARESYSGRFSSDSPSRVSRSNDNAKGGDAMDGVENTVFIVDDTDEVRLGLSRLLAAAGYRVKSFKSAEAFLKEQDEAEAGCLLLDVFLPGLSGIE